MESVPPEITADVAVKGMSVLSAIFVVLFALWGQYFTDYAQETADEAPAKYDPRPDLAKVRMAGVMTLFFEFFLYLGTAEVRDSYPITGNGMFVLAIAAQALVQTSVEKKIRELGKSFERTLALARARSVADGAQPIESPAPAPAPAAGIPYAGPTRPRDRLVEGIKGMLWCAVAGATHIGVFFAVITVSMLAIKALHFSKPVAAALVVLSAALALGASLAGAFALAPLQIRKAFRVSPVGDCGLTAEVARLFREAGLSEPSVWILEAERIANAMISGFGKGRGWFRPAIFLSRRLVESLDDAELRAIVLHEVSHARLRHVRKRFVFTAAIVAVGLIVAVIGVVTTAALHVGMEAGTWIGPIVAFAQVSAFIALVGRQSRAHEAEADAHAVEKLGASPLALIAALGKIDEINRRGSGARSFTHPSTESRISAIRARFANQAAATSPADSQDRAA